MLLTFLRCHQIFSPTTLGHVDIVIKPIHSWHFHIFQPIKTFSNLQTKFTNFSRANSQIFPKCQPPWETCIEIVSTNQFNNYILQQNFRLETCELTHVRVFGFPLYWGRLNVGLQQADLMRLAGHVWLLLDTQRKPHHEMWQIYANRMSQNSKSNINGQSISAWHCFFVFLKMRNNDKMKMINLSD